MNFIALPLIPFTLLSALFFRSRLAAYGFPIMLVLLKMVLTQISPIYVFTAAALIIFTACVRYIHRSEGVSLRQTLFYAAWGVVVFEVISNLGVWAIGGCGVGQASLTLAQLVEVFKQSLPYSALHLAKAVFLSVPVVMAAHALKHRSIRMFWAKEAV